MTEALINGVPYPVAVSKEDGLLWRVADVGGPVERTWQNWSGGMGQTEEGREDGYLYSDGFDATREGVLRFYPHLKRLNNPILSQNHGYFFEALGAAATVTFDAGTRQSVTAASTATISTHTIASQSNRLLMASAHTQTNGPTGVTVNGTPMTKLAQGDVGTAGVRLSVWYLIAPPVGTPTIVFTMTGSATGSVGVDSYYNVSQTNPFRSAASKTTSSGTSASVTVAGATGDMVFDAICVATAATSLAVTGGQTANWTIAKNTVSAGSSREAGAASVAVSYGWTTSAAYMIIAVPIRPITQPYIYCADGDVIHKMTYDSDVGISPVVIDSGTATSAAAGTLVDSTANFTGDENYHVRITGGTGSGQWRRISSLTGTTQLNITPNWDITPSTDSTYQVVVSLYTASASYGRPAYFLSKWYVPAGAAVNVRRLDAIGTTTDTWADSGFVSLHLSTFQKKTTPHIAGAKDTQTIGTASAAPTSALATLGTVGDTSTTITDLVEIQGYLFVAKEDGLYEFDPDGFSRPVLAGLSRSNVDNQNGRYTLAFGDMVFYGAKSGFHRYLIGSGSRPVGIETIKGFRRVANTGITPPKDRRVAWAVERGGFLYAAYNDTSSKSLLCQAELGREPLVWHSFKDTDLTKGAFIDSLNHVWLKGASSDEAVRDIMVFELAPDGSLDTQYRKGAVSETYTIVFSEWTPNDGEQVQDRAFEAELSGGWSAQTSLQPQVYRDDGNSAESVGSAITAAGVTINNWTTGTTDTAYRSFTVLQVTTGATYTPLASDPMVLRVRRKGRKPMIYRCVIDANDVVLQGYGMTAEDARQNLYRLQDQGVIAIAEPGPSGPKTSTFSAEVVSVKDVRYETPQGIGYGIELLLRRYVHD